MPVCAGLCQFVPVSAGLCRFVPVSAGLCRFVPVCAFFVPHDSSVLFAGKQLARPLFLVVEKHREQKKGTLVSIAPLSPRKKLFLVSSRENPRVILSRYFLVCIGQYFTVNTIPIPKENSVGTFSIVDTKKYVFTVSKGDDDGSEDDNGIDRLNGGAMIFGGVDAVMMMPTTNDAAASASSVSFATAWTTTPPSTMPPPTAATTTPIGGEGDAVVTNEEYNYLVLMADNGLLRVGGQTVNVDERGCGRGRGYDADAAAAAAAMMFDAQWVVERPPRTGRRRRATTSRML